MANETGQEQQTSSLPEALKHPNTYIYMVLLFPMHKTLKSLEITL